MLIKKSLLILIAGCFLYNWITEEVHAIDSAPNKPQRIVSINICSDEILLRFVDRSRIASVSANATVPRLSSVVDLAEGIPQNYSTAEEILLLQPDLVLASSFYTKKTVAILEKLGVNVKFMKNPKNYTELKEYILDVAKTLGEEEKGLEMVRDIEQRLLKVKSQITNTADVVFYWPGGVTAGANTLISDIIESAGGRNVARDLNMTKDRILDLEHLILVDPELVVVSDYKRDVQTISREFLSHPIIRQKFPESETVAIPLSTIFCGSPANVEATEILAKKIKEIKNKDEHTQK